MTQNIPYLSYLGRFSTLAALNSLHSPTYVQIGTHAFTNDQGLVFANGTAWVSSGVGGGATPQWTKVGSGITYANLSAAALINSINLFQLPARGVLEGIAIIPSASFQGGGITGYSFSVGISGFLDKYASGIDVFQAPTATTLELSGNFVMENKSNPTQVLLSATSVGANLNSATAGAVDVWAKYAVLP